MKVRVRCEKEYHDKELGRIIKPDKSDKDYERTIDKIRADEIISKTNGAIKIIGVVKEEKIDNAMLEVDCERAVRTSNKKKREK